MQYPGPSADDLDNVHTLNAAFLEELRQRSCGDELRDHGAPRLTELVRGLTAAQVGRLATSPFLLFSLHERDNDYWEALLARESAPDTGLFARHESFGDGCLLASALSFLWGLAGRNPYAARVVSGAPIAWCERLAEQTIYRLLSNATTGVAPIVPRFRTQRGVWHKLLGDGVSSEEEVRKAAQLTALQVMLTRSTDDIRAR